jgi:fibronectin-binding autotransporter adhesin
MAITVTNTSDGAEPGPAGSLRKAINDAAAGGTIDFASGVTGAIILTNGQLVISKNVTLVGPGARVLAVSGNNAGRVIFISRNIAATVSGLTIRDGLISPDIDPNSSQGGGIYNDGNLTLIQCKITANRVEAPAPTGNAIPHQANGAGIVNYIASTLTMRECEISYNVAHANNAFGCGIYNVGTATLTNCTISNNQIELIGNFPDGRGAGIRNVRFGSFGGANPYNQYGLATLRLINSTVTNNGIGTGGTGAGIQRSFDAPTYLRNTIVAGNTAPDRPDVSSEGGAGVFNSEGHNLIGIIDGTGGWITDPNDPNRDYTGTAAQPLDPGLVDPGSGTIAPGNNGGPTNTIALLPTSPAVDKGDDVVLDAPYNLTTDQRGPGFSRKLGAHTDIGAFELDQPQVAPDFVVTTTDEHSDGLCGMADCTLIEALNASNANASANTITFAPGVSGTIFNSFSPGRSIAHPLTIIGPGARTLTIDGKGAHRIFNIQPVAGSVTISGLTLANGKAETSGAFPNGSGGAILNAASLTLTECTLIGNSSDVHGGAILNDGSSGGNATLILNNCALSGNSSSASAGAIFNLGAAAGHATLNLTNCTLNQNSAGEHGGAIYSDGTNAGNTALTLTNCTFNQNNGTLSTGGVYNDAFNDGQQQGTATLTLRNTIFRAGISGANIVNELGTVTSQGSNISDDAAGGDGTTVPGGLLNGSGDKRNTNPQLLALANNGGPTDTCALGSTSVAINAGKDNNAPHRDQRGYSRKGVSDIGAFEFNGIALHVISINRNGTNIVISFNATTGETYRLERKLNVTVDNWDIVPGINDLAALMTATMQFTDTNAINQGHAVYRVRLVP